MGKKIQNIYGKGKEGRNCIQQKDKTTEKPGTVRGESMCRRNGIKPVKMGLMNKKLL